jgi:geranylgeranyl pyrophosphate synthase
MSIHADAAAYIQGLPIFENWPEMLRLYRQVAALEPYGWILSTSSCYAVGGFPDQVLPVVAAYGCLQTSILLIDDLLDEDPRGMHHQYGVGLAANMASAFQALALEIIFASQYEQSVKTSIIRSLNEMMARLAVGQYRDVQNSGTEEGYWQVVSMKSSPYSAAALEVGALAGGAGFEVNRQLKQFGDLYGEFMQLNDDLKDVMAFPANTDWVLGRFPLPILFAEAVNHPDRQRFRQLRSNMTDDNALREAQTILVRCGAITYCIDQLLQRYKRAEEVLAEIPLARPEELDSLLERTVKATRRVLATLGNGYKLEEVLAVQ